MIIAFSDTVEGAVIASAYTGWELCKHTGKGPCIVLNWDGEPFSTDFIHIRVTDTPTELPVHYRVPVNQILNVLKKEGL